MRIRLLGAATALLLLGAPAVASAHVTVAPAQAPAGSFTRFDVRVPTEKSDASTVKLEVKFPPGFASVSYQPVPGWAVKVETARLAKPVQTDDGPVTEGVDTITWTADSSRDGIPPSAFEDFGITAVVPGKTGDKLAFKALQTYSDGDIVRWIGPESSDNPAAVVTVGTTAATGEGAASRPAAAAPAAAAEDSGTSALTIVALVLGALGLAAGVAGLAAARRLRADREARVG